MAVIRVEKNIFDEVVKFLSGYTIRVVRQSQRDLIKVEEEVNIKKLPDGAKLMSQDYPWLDWKEVE